MTQVDDFGCAVCGGRKHDVTRCDVVVTKSLRMYVLQALHDIAEEGEGILFSQFAFTLYFLNEQFATEIVGQIVLDGSFFCVRLTTIHITDDVFMFQVLAVFYFQYLSRLCVEQFLRHFFEDKDLHEIRGLVFVFHTVGFGIQVLLDEALHNIPANVLSTIECCHS